MRDILFRAKRADGGGWEYGLYAEFVEPAHGKSIYGIAEKRSRHYYEIDPSTLGEYTGVQDAGKRRIFEGDIVIYHAPLNPWIDDIDNEAVGEIAYFGGAFYAKIKRSALTANQYLVNHFFGAHGCTLEIIGNIHDNPELLRRE